MTLTIAYLVNQYPKVSHSFIRREIAGLEQCGIQVARFSIRSCHSELVDEDDILELQKTRIVLNAGFLTFGLSLVRILFSRPIQFCKALWLALRMGWAANGTLFRHCVYLVEACVLIPWLSEVGVSHVHAHFGTNSTTVAVLCHMLGGPSYSFTVHGPEEFDRPDALSLRDKIKRALFVVAISSFGKSQLYRWSDSEQWHKIHVVRCGVDETFLAHPPTSIPMEPNLVCVARLSEQKGHFVLLKAVKQLVNEGYNLRLVMVGDGPLRSEIESWIRQAGLSDRIRITGWASGAEVRQYLLESRVFVLPSFAEGLPVVIMEALALGRPVVSTYVAGIPELVEPNVCGWLSPAGAVEPLVDGLREALEASPEMMAQMGRTGYERVCDRHSATTESQRLAELFKVKLNVIQSDLSKEKKYLIENVT